MPRCSTLSMPAADPRQWPRGRRRRSSAPGDTYVVSDPGSAVTTASDGSTEPTRSTPPSRPLCGRGDTYPEQVIFAKGHGTQNDFVLLGDLTAEISLTPAAVGALCDRRRGLGADGVLR